MTRLPLLLALVLSLLTVDVAGAAGLPSAKPQEVGLSSERLDRIGQVLRADVEKGRIAGAVVVVARKGKVATVQVAGLRDKDAGLAMTGDAIFRLASMTKPMVTVGALVLFEEGRLLLSDPVSKHLPALGKPTVGVEQAPAEREMTIQDLMRHTSGLTYGNRGKTDLYKAYPESSTWASMNLTGPQLIERLAKAPLLHQPGTVWEYGLSTDVLGLVVEAVAKQSLGAFLDERLFKPLKMNDTSFVVPADKRARIAQPLAKHPDTGAPYTLADPTVARKFECGGGCANATAGDYVRFAQMLLNGGSLDGARILGPRTVEYMTADHLGKISRGLFTFAGPAYTWGLGVAVRQEKGLSAIPGSAGDFFWPGAFTTYWWADPKEQMVVVSMLQAPLGRHYQETVRSLVYQAIVE